MKYKLAYNIEVVELERRLLGSDADGGLLLDLDAARIAEAGSDQLVDLVGLRCREEAGASLLGQVFEDCFDRLLKAHVEEPIGLVQYEHIERLELLTHVEATTAGTGASIRRRAVVASSSSSSSSQHVGEATSSGDNYVRALCAKLLDVVVDAVAADE